MERPKVLLLGKLPPPYLGPAVATQILLDSDLKRRFNLLHVDTNVHESLSTLGKWSFEKVVKNLQVYTRFINVLKEKPDLVLVPISQATLGFLKDSVFIILSRIFGHKTLLQLRGSNFKNWFESSSKPMRLYIESVLRVAQGVIVLGENLRYLFAEFYPEERIFVVPNGASYQIPRTEPPRKDGSVKVLYLANLQPSKGVEDVIQGVSLLKEKGVNNFTVDVIGAWRDAETKEACLKIVEEEGLPVTFHGPAYGAEKFKFMSQADMFIFTPREPEGHPWVIVEALAAALPVISTDQGAIVESVQDEVNGYIVDSCSPEQIADRLRRLIEQPDLRRAQGEASLQHYKANFTEEKMVERLGTVFDALLKQA